jgi:homoserine kinase
MSGSGPSVIGIYNKSIDTSDLRDIFEVYETVTVDQGVILEQL